MSVDADGAYRAYHPDDIGLDSLDNAGNGAEWWGIATDESGNPIIQQSTDTAPGYYVSITALSECNKLDSDPRAYVNSVKILYFVLPASRSGWAEVGDLGVVINLENFKRSYAIYDDISPVDKLGEGSIALARALGVNANARYGGVDSNILYIVLRGSGKGECTLRSIQEINKKSSKLFKK
jgi:hypothetical protein